jgi:hypothetical protein
MITFLVRRVAWLFATLLVVYTVTFFLMRAVPGGPFSSERQPPPEIREAIARRYKLDLPLSQQYVTELSRLLRGDLGMSFRLADYSVAEVIAEGWQASATLGTVAMVLAIVVGGGAGVISAARPGGLVDGLVRVSTMVGISLPSFALAGVAVLLVVYQWRLLPGSGLRGGDCPAGAVGRRRGDAVRLGADRAGQRGQPEPHRAAPCGPWGDWPGGEFSRACHCRDPHRQRCRREGICDSWHRLPLHRGGHHPRLHAGDGACAALHAALRCGWDPRGSRAGRPRPPHRSGEVTGGIR